MHAKIPVPRLFSFLKLGRATYHLRLYIAPIVISLVMAIPYGCTSRYRLDIYLTSEQPRKKVSLDQTEYAARTILRGPEAENKLADGPGNCVVLALGTRGARQNTPQGNVLGYDEYLKYQIYLQLPALLRRDTILLAGNSFVTLLGKYELPSTATVYRPSSGELIIDSVLATRFFGTLRGEFTNALGGSLKFDGRFKVKTAR